MSDISDTTPPATPPLSEWETLAVARAKIEAELFTLNKAELLNALALAGVTHVVVTFDGYGDSGQIEDVQVMAGDDDMVMPSAIVEISEAVWGEPEPKRSTVNLATAVESLAYDVLERTHGGWENNDGAYGEITFDVAGNAITLDYNERYTATENYNHGF